MMKKMLASIAVAVSGAPVLVNAATLPVTAFTLSTGVNSPSVVTPALITLVGTSSITGQVNGLSSFEWKFTSGDIAIPEFNDYSYFTTSAGTVQLSDILTVGSFGTSGWRQYVLASPYSGTITLGVQNRLDDENPSELQLRNLIAASAVPEPSSYAMLLAGLGWMGVIATRGARRRATI